MRNYHTYLDEFCKPCKFTNYENFLATCRGYGIGVATIIQTLTQLQDNIIAAAEREIVAFKFA